MADRAEQHTAEVPWPWLPTTSSAAPSAAASSSARERRSMHLPRRRVRHGRRSVLPAVAALAEHHPNVHVLINEFEPAEALRALLADDLDLALVYDYDLDPATLDPGLILDPLWTVPWGLGVPAADVRRIRGEGTLAVFDAFRDHDWIGNSRNNADENVVRALASMAGFTPRVTHRADNLDLVEDLITASGRGVGLLPVDRPIRSGVAVLALTGPDLGQRAFACTRRGRAAWPPLASLLNPLAR